MTFDEVRRLLGRIEPTEEMYAPLDIADLPHLQRLAHGPDPLTAARAIFAASRIPGAGSDALIARAAADPRPEMRIAALAQGRRPLPPGTVERLLRDSDAGVAKFAERAVRMKSARSVSHSRRGEP